MLTDDTSRLQHLLRRAAFGCRSTEWPQWSALGPEKAVNALVDYGGTPDPIPLLPTDSMGSLVAPQDTDALKRYWLYRFCETARPLEEVMTLFWHGHFATSDYKVQNPSIEWRQNRLLRTHAMGSFRDMIGAIATDPAMLVWLDGNNSKKTAPNENFSRELLELFAMGVHGGYTEKDVKEGARAFTGWFYNDDRSKVTFNEKDHDDKPKSYLGKEGPLTADQALDIVAAHPSTARFISTKLFEYFVYDGPPEDEIARLSKIYLDSKYSIKELVRGILTSHHFYSDKALYSRVKSPVQYTVMLVKTLDVPYKWINDMQNYADTMGQKLYDPPNVKGWKMGQSWINTNTMTARLNFATHAVDELRYRNLVREHVTAAFKAFGRNADTIFSDSEGAVLGVWSWLLPSTSIPDETLAALTAYMKSNMPKKPGKDVYWNHAAGLVELVLTCPQYQLA